MVVPLVKVGCGKHAVVRLVIDDPGAIPEEDQSHGLAGTDHPRPELPEAWAQSTIIISSCFIRYKPSRKIARINLQRHHPTSNSNRQSLIPPP